jgi:signal-transduction protein with cAMP-binding, CBS, and nucleotidyltransferase domain
VVVEKGALANEMYFIVAGEAEVLASLDEPPFVTLKEGTFFGETALLVEAPRNAYVRASKTMEMYVLSKTNLHAVFLEFPHVEQIMQHFADGEARRKELLAAEEEARTHNVTGRPVHQHKKARKKVHLAPARSVEELVRQLNLCSRLCSRASAVLALCVAWHVNGEPEAHKDGEVAQEIANNFAKHSGEIKTASLLPAEMLHQVLQRCELHVAGVN